jgi:hypothetical protein
MKRDERGQPPVFDSQPGSGRGIVAFLEAGQPFEPVHGDICIALCKSRHLQDQLSIGASHHHRCSHVKCEVSLCPTHPTTDQWWDCRCPLGARNCTLNDCGRRQYGGTGLSHADQARICGRSHLSRRRGDLDGRKRDNPAGGRRPVGVAWSCLLSKERGEHWQASDHEIDEFLKRFAPAAGPG